MQKGYHWGPGVLQVMWEAYGLNNEDILWTCSAFNGGIAGQQSDNLDECCPPDKISGGR